MYFPLGLFNWERIALTFNKLGLETPRNDTVETAISKLLRQLVFQKASGEVPNSLPFNVKFLTVTHRDVINF